MPDVLTLLEQLAARRVRAVAEIVDFFEQLFDLVVIFFEQFEHVGHRVFPLPTDSAQLPVSPRPPMTPDSNVTLETPVGVRRTTLKLPSVPVPLPKRESLPQVSVNRRLRGSLIALGLVVIFLALATWWTYRAASAVLPQQRSGATAPSGARP